MLPFTLCTFTLAMATAVDITSGDHRFELTVDGRQRTYLVHVPATKMPDDGWPVVLAYHGGATNADTMARFSGMSGKADAAGFVVVYPNGIGLTEAALTFNGGNCCGRAMLEKVDDVKFTTELLDDLASKLSVNPKRVFATGISNGAIMSYLLASQLSNRIAAIAPVAGPMGTPTCDPKRPVPVCHFHGTNDAFAPFGGGRGPRSISKTNFYSVEHSIAQWVKANGCERIPMTEELPMVVDDGTKVTRSVYANPNSNAEVVLYTIHGGGHTWPGGDRPLRLLGVTTKNLSANDVMWEFFQAHPLP